jgi:hypothetical protein
MKIIIVTLASAAVVGLAACTTVTTSQPPASSSPARSSPASGSSPPSPSATPSQQAGPPAPSATTAPSVTNPWAVVSAYYGDIESGDYQQAWALINSGATTGQTYQQFVDGFACTGSQQLTELSESGDQVSFDLAATNSCSGTVQHFTGTDTVENGKIVAATVHQTS